MPPGTPDHGFVPPYAIRVDAFGGGAPRPAALHLLTHTHADHVGGLQARGFAQPVVCSADAKAMLLRHEILAERALYDGDVRAERVRTYAHLRVEPVLRGGALAVHGARDLLVRAPKRIHARPLIHRSAHTGCTSPSWPSSPHPSPSRSRSSTRTTAPAPSCVPPPSVQSPQILTERRYLVDGPRGALLHTGDVRAEPHFLAALARNPHVQRFLAPPPGAPPNGHVHRQLAAIHLDTACVLSDSELLPKVRAFVCAYRGGC
jgi:DNA cross-link repair 1C protein